MFKRQINFTKKLYGKSHKYSKILVAIPEINIELQEKQQYPFPACNHKKGKV